MNEKKYSVFETLIKFSWVMVFVYLLEYMILHNNMLTTFIWVISALALSIACIMYIYVIDKNELCAIATIIFIIILGLLRGWEQIGSEHIIAAWLYITYIVSISVCSTITLSNKTLYFIFYICMIILIAFFVLSFTDIATRQMFKGAYRQSIYFVFNLDNSNVAGIYLFCVLCMLIVNFNNVKKKYMVIVMIIIALYLIYRTNARSCIISALGVLIAYFLLKGKYVPKFIIWMCVLIPIFFIFVYMGMYNSGVEDIEILGKGLFSGRQDVYMSYLRQMDNLIDYIIGDFSNMPLQNAHNGPLSVFCGIGGVGTICMYYIVIHALYKTYKRNSSKISSIAVICILCCFIQ